MRDEPQNPRPNRTLGRCAVEFTDDRETINGRVMMLPNGWIQFEEDGDPTVPEYYPPSVIAGVYR